MTRMLAIVLLVAGSTLGGWSVRSLVVALDDGSAGSLRHLSVDATPSASAPPASGAAATDDQRAALEPRVDAAPSPRQRVVTRSARLDDVADDPPAVAAPARLRIPSLGIDAPVGAVGVMDDGSLEIPEDVSRLGWYRYGPRPGDDAGSSVVSGHVDSRSQGPGAFFDLARVDVGAVVEVGLADGRTLSYVVTGRQRIDKDLLPVDDVFRRAGAPVLTLITCGGAFDRTERSYADNVVVVAEPVA